MKRLWNQIVTSVSEQSDKRFRSGRLKPVRTFAFFALLVFVVIVVLLIRQNATAVPGGDEIVAQAQENLALSQDFQFIGQGQVTAGSDGVWVIGGVPIQVDDHTQLLSDVHGGDFVNLTGRILKNGTWLADRIELVQGDESFFTFNGPLDWMRGSVWRIGGHSLLVNSQTELGSDLVVGDILLATFTVLDNGAWLALKIVAFDRFPPTPTPTATPQPTTTPTPTPKIKPANTPAPASNPKNSNSGGITVCHKPGNNKKGGKTITLEQSALQGHLSHGDSLGPCP